MGSLSHQFVAKCDASARNCRNIAISPIDLGFGEQTAQACAYRLVTATVITAIVKQTRSRLCAQLGL
jgi:hypothetical protein